MWTKLIHNEQGTVRTHGKNPATKTIESICSMLIGFSAHKQKILFIWISGFCQMIRRRFQFSKR